ncbi:MAG: hypothetical protein IKL52_00020 [Candidatus Gastranaerophilales bacterium]|nr:hypothetical protein [Candidatus Gastranaerophilales bacterium]
MRKIIAILFLMFFINANAQEPIQIGITYNEATARIEAFKNVQKKIEKDFYSKYKKDPNRIENIELIKKNYFIAQNRTLCPFYIKNTLASYAVMYNDEPNYAFYYNILGNLIKIDITSNENYPKKTYGYSRFGNLISVALEASEIEQFVYDENGKLIAHWLGDELLNKNNKTPKMLKLKRGK